MNGFIAYRGPSRLDGAPIVAIVTLASLNAKTGDMAQAWVLRADQTPSEAIASGEDRSICGSCVHRSGGTVARSCYVTWWFGPTNVYKSFQAGRYPVLDPVECTEALRGAQLRLTAYGDPVAVPFSVWHQLLRQTSGHTGYTHGWRTCDQRFRRFLMASVESEAEADLAHALGWRTFRARLASEAVRADEIVCPASAEAGHRAICADCGLCVGLLRPSARSVAIVAHGQRTSWLEEKKLEVLA